MSIGREKQQKSRNYEIRKWGNLASEYRSPNPETRNKSKLMEFSKPQREGSAETEIAVLGNLGEDARSAYEKT
jgi:hypothetical protein